MCGFERDGGGWVRKLIVLVVVAVVALGVPVAAAGATTSTVSITSCGQVITTDAVLRTDLTCSGTALTVLANGVEVRLAGHTIRSSDGTGDGVQLGVPSGSISFPPVQGVVIRGGTITGFANGIDVEDANAADQISRMILTDNTNGVFIWVDALANIDHTTIVGTNGIMGGKYFAGRSTITDSTITVDGGTNLDTGGSTITASRLTGGEIVSEEGDGVTIQHSQLAEVTVFCGDIDLVITDSHLVGGEIQGGSGCYMNISRDRFIGTGSGTAIHNPASFSRPSVVADNHFSGWGDAVVGAGAPSPVLITGNTFDHNVNGVIGCTNPNGCTGGTVTGNRFVDNTGTGLLLSAGTWTIGSNTALRNGGLGIDAEGATLTVTDLGGNTARHNQPPQCIGVVCTP
jgi:hypothetical protein